jgi:hypothetical protein
LIEIERFKRLDRGHLVGVADIIIPEWRLKIQGVGIFNKNGAKWVNLPQKTYQGTDGGTKYADTLQWTDNAVASRFRDAVLEALEQAGHLPKVKKTDAPKRNRRNPDKMLFRPNFRPEGHPTPTPASDDLPW